MTGNFVIAAIIAAIIWLMLAANLGHAASYTSHKDSAGYTHYYNSKGHQTCYSKRDAAGYTHYHCQDEDDD